MQRDIKLGLGVGLVLLVLCGFFYIRMRSSGTEPETPDSALEKAFGIEGAQETKTSSLDKELPEVVKTESADAEVSVKEETATADIPSLTVEPPAEPEKPNAVGTLGPPTVITEEKAEKTEDENVEEEPLAPKEPKFPVRQVEKKEPSTAAFEPFAASRGGEEYEVRPGDTLSRVSSEVLGSAKYWKKIYEANRDKLSSPDRLIVGMTLTIPKITAEEEKPAPAKEPMLITPAAPEEDDATIHVVKKGETLSDIAENRLGDRNKWRRIAKANPDINPDRLQIGQKIKIPQAE